MAPLSVTESAPGTSHYSWCADVHKRHTAYVRVFVYMYVHVQVGLHVFILLKVT
jgi:hypothetical protein